jgi:hypothetical protein
MLVEVTELILAAGTSPNTTVASCWKFLPVIVTVVPPAAGPEVGKRLTSFGGPVPFVELLISGERGPPQPNRKLIRLRQAAATATSLECRAFSRKMIVFTSASGPPTPRSTVPFAIAEPNGRRSADRKRRLRNPKDKLVGISSCQALVAATLSLKAECLPTLTSAARL